MKKIIILLLAITLIFALASCKKDKDNQPTDCSGHVDADDNHKCDKCNADFEDGDEVVEIPTTYRNVTFSFTLEDGTPVEGVSFTVERGSNIFNLVTGTDGKATQELATGLYSLNCDYTTLPEFCSIDTYGFKVEENTSSVVILVTNNTPDGSREKPFPTSDEPTDLVIDVSQEIFFTYRGTSVQHITINSSDVIVNFNGESYSAVDGLISVVIAPEEIGELTIFSIKNVSGAEAYITLEMISPLGSFDNPIEINADYFGDLFQDGVIRYYKWTAPKDGVFIARPTMANANVTVRRNITKIVDGEEIIIPIVMQSDDGSAVYMSVDAGDEIIIGLTAVDPGITTSIELALLLYEGTASDPVPMYNNSVAISLDGGESLMFIAIGSNGVSIDECHDLIAKCGSNTCTSEGGSISFDLVDWSFEIINTSEDRNSIIIKLS